MTSTTTAATTSHNPFGRVFRTRAGAAALAAREAGYAALFDAVLVVAEVDGGFQVNWINPA